MLCNGPAEQLLVLVKVVTSPKQGQVPAFLFTVQTDFQAKLQECYTGCSLLLNFKDRAPHILGASSGHVQGQLGGQPLVKTGGRTSKASAGGSANVSETMRPWPGRHLGLSRLLTGHCLPS